MKNFSKFIDTLWFFAIFWTGSVPTATTVRGLPGISAERRSAIPRWRWRFALP